MTKSSPVQSTTEPRFYNDVVHSLYLLPADTEEGHRLNEQHEVIKYSAGGKLVVAPVQLGEGDKVLDCATGTGVWLVDLATKTPANVLFDGIDISPHLFPSPHNTPSNVTFREHSILALPESFSSAYALVNHRLLVAAFRSGEWPQALETYFRVLRPGGWVQLCEIYPGGFTPQAPHTTRMFGIFDAIMEKRGMIHEAALHLADWARAAGFANVQTMRTRAYVGARAGNNGKNYTGCMLSVFRAITDIVLQHGLAESREHYEQQIRDMEDEWNKLEGPYLPFIWVCGQKLSENDELK